MGKALGSCQDNINFAPFHRCKKNAKASQKLWSLHCGAEGYELSYSAARSKTAGSDDTTSLFSFDIVAAIQRQQSFPFQASLICPCSTVKIQHLVSHAVANGLWAPRACLEACVPAHYVQHCCCNKSVMEQIGIVTCDPASFQRHCQQVGETAEFSGFGGVQVALPQYQDSNFLRRAHSRYAAFLYLMKHSPGTFMVPTYDIDLMWHAHQVRLMADIDGQGTAARSQGHEIASVVSRTKRCALAHNALQTSTASIYCVDVDKPTSGMMQASIKPKANHVIR